MTTPVPDKIYTDVYGHKVLASEPVKSALSAAAEARGRPPVYFKGAVKLLLDDGSEVYGCRWCGTFTDKKIGRLRIHQRSFCEVKPRTPKPQKVSVTSVTEPRWDGKEMTTFTFHEGGKSAPAEPPPSEVADILAVLSAMGKPATAENEELKKENAALKAERDQVTARYKKLEGEVREVRAMLKTLGLIK